MAMAKIGMVCETTSSGYRIQRSTRRKVHQRRDAHAEHDRHRQPGQRFPQRFGDVLLQQSDPGAICQASDISCGVGKMLSNDRFSVACASM